MHADKRQRNDRDQARRPRRTVPVVLTLLLYLCSSAFICGSSAAFAQDKKDAARVTVAAPLGVAPGATTRVVIRGLKLDTATEIRFPDSATTAKILKKSKTPVPNQQDPTRWGDTQIEADVTLPATTPPGPLSMIVLTPAGDTPPHKLLVETDVVKEKEPNNGFRQPQPLAVPQIMDGAIGSPQDVDVFRIEGPAGQRLIIEVLAGRYGSVLDSTLTLYDDAGRQLAANDDADGNDSRLEVTLPRDGVYHLALADAHDQGGPAHVYRLLIRLEN